MWKLIILICEETILKETALMQVTKKYPNNLRKKLIMQFILAIDSCKKVTLLIAAKSQPIRLTHHRYKVHNVSKNCTPLGTCFYETAKV